MLLSVFESEEEEEEGLQSDGGRGQEEKTGWGVTEGEGGWAEVVSNWRWYGMREERRRVWVDLITFCSSVEKLHFPPSVVFLD
jgi:hypothetical protein